MKKCSKCKEFKELTNFHKCKTNKDGFNYWCKNCLQKAQHKRRYGKGKRSKRSLLCEEDFGNGIDKIYLTKGLVAIVDEDDYSKLIKFIWSTDGKDYAITDKNGKQIRMHRFIVNAKYGDYIDHINGNRLDNRKCNLRICTCQQNNQHRTVFGSNNTSGKIGVGYCKTYNKWRARIKVDKLEKFLGYFDNIEDAIKARKEAEEKYFCEFKPHF